MGNNIFILCLFVCLFVVLDHKYDSVQNPLLFIVNILSENIFYLETKSSESLTSNLCKNFRIYNGTLKSFVCSHMIINQMFKFVYFYFCFLFKSDLIRNNGVNICYQTKSIIDILAWRVLREFEFMNLDQDQDSGFRFRIQNLGFRIQDSGFRTQDSGFRIQESGFRTQDL